MQESPDPLAWLLRQLTDLGNTLAKQARQQKATALGQPHRNAPALTLSVVLAVRLPASTIAQADAAPYPANDNAEG